MGLVLFPFPFEPVSLIMFAIELFIAAFLLYLGIYYKKYIAVLLVLTQTA